MSKTSITLFTITLLIMTMIITFKVILGAQTPPPPTTLPWFTANIGPTTCRVSQVIQTPIRVSWVCTNLYGATAGSYTADPTNGLNGANYLYIGLNTVPAQIPTNPNPVWGNASCLIQMNGTANSLMMVNGIAVPANSAAYSCTGYVTAGQGTATWPVSTPKP